ncbi:MAG: hypothetical protein ACI93R_001498 [Flavobacteriales bacterium]|jgi:hypothetical protein
MATILKKYIGFMTIGISFVFLASCSSLDDDLPNSKWECVVTSFGGYGLLYSEALKKGDYISLDLAELQKTEGGILKFQSSHNGDGKSFISYLKAFDKDEKITDDKGEQLGLVLSANEGKANSVVLELHTLGNENTAHISLRVIQDVTMSIVFLSCEIDKRREVTGARTIKKIEILVVTSRMDFLRVSFL